MARISPLRTIDTRPHDISCLTFSPREDGLVCGYRDGGVQAWDLAAGRPHTTYIESGAQYAGPILCVAFSPDGALLAAANVGYYPTRMEQAIHVWHATSGALAYALGGFHWQVYASIFSPDGALIAIGGDDKLVKLYDARTGEERGPHFPQMNYSISSLAFSPDGRLLVAGCDGCEIKLLSLGTGQVIRTLQGHVEWTSALAFHPSGSVFASGGEDGEIVLRDAHTGTTLREIRASYFPPLNRKPIPGDHAIGSLAISPNGELLASGSYQDHVLEIWDFSTGARLFDMAIDGDASAVAFSPDGKILASDVGDHTLRLWRIE